MAKIQKIEKGQLVELQKQYEAERMHCDWIKVGMGTGGRAAGAEPVFLALREAVRRAELEIDVRQTGSIGLCWAEPLVEIKIAGMPRVMYGNVDEQIVQEIFEKHVLGKQVVEEHRVPGVETLGFDAQVLGDLKPDSKQRRIVMRNCGVIDPGSLEDYIARGGYQALEKAIFELGDQGVIQTLKDSGLRGRGGAGFPTHLKWSFANKATGQEKFMICNGDEGDPGAYMDRAVLEGDPHAVVEGMIIGGLAIGAESGFFYIRAEYPLAISHIENAVRQARRAGLLGKNILGSEFNFDLDIRLGAGAFVCGEETALIASIEGKRGTPRPRPPFPANRGLWEEPSNINNVETLANVPQIIANGGPWFAEVGTEQSKGTKVFAVTGKVKRSGLVEIPMGTTLRDIVEGIGHGVEEGKTLKAVQTGGPSGGVIPEDKLDTPVSYESLLELGSIMGSGGMIVMDNGDNMVDIAKFYLGFCVDESCGKCAPCRIGGKQMLDLLVKISDGKGSADDIATLRRICHAMQRASLCALGQTAPNPVLSTLKYFGEEYEQAIA